MSSPKKNSSKPKDEDMEAEPLLQHAMSRDKELKQQHNHDDGHEHDASYSCGSCDAPKGELRTCRICFETEDSIEDADPDNPLISPCQCSGSSRYVHRKCLDQWRHSSHRQDAYYQCEVCKFKYEYRRLWYADVLGSQVTLTLLFLTVVTTGCLLLGFIPIFGHDSFGTHMLNGFVMLGILGLSASLLLCCFQAAGVQLPDFLASAPDCRHFCMNCTGGPFLYLGDLGAAAECGYFLLGMLVLVGFLFACYMIYAMLWHLTKRALDTAQHMVENVGERHAAPCVEEGEALV